MYIYILSFLQFYTMDKLMENTMAVLCSSYNETFPSWNFSIHRVQSLTELCNENKNKVTHTQ